MTTLAELIERLAKATGPDRELDAQVWLATSPGVTRDTKHVVSATGAWPSYDIDVTRDETGWLITVPPFTASLDAAVALAERALPGWKFYVGNWNVRAAVLSPDRNNDHDATAATPALALCLATLKALEATR